MIYKRFVIGALIGCVVLTAFSISHSLFSDQATSAQNTFTAAATFPTFSPTPSTTVGPTNTPIPTAISSPTPSTIPINPGDVVINEVMWMGSDLDSDDEWLELRNTTGSPIDLTGWKLEGAATSSTVITIPSGTVEGNGFFLISHFNENNVTSILNIAPDYVTTTLQLDNTAAQIRLKNSSDVLIDTADDSSGSPLAGDNGTINKSMERNNSAGDGTLTSNWHDASTQTNIDAGATELATPKSPNSL